MVGSGGLLALYATQQYNNPIWFNKSYWEVADTGAPTNEAAQNKALRSLIATPTNPVQIRFRNESDVEVTDEFIVEMQLRQVKY
ncbi:hypothetical protein DV707_07060 [Halobellus limi]|nr:hypothetical protein DV707_07060 [Halobellus limi]